jgi:predicted O-methyltransferase YrrM
MNACKEMAPERSVAPKRLSIALRLVALVGDYQLRRIIKDGLHPSLSTPFLYLMDGRLSVEDDEVVQKIEGIRSELAKRDQEFVGVFHETKGGPNTEHASSEGLRKGLGSRRSLTQVACVSSVLPQWGTFLYLCANATGAKTILELGAGAGISGCYLASSKRCQRFITVEGSPDRATLAQAHPSRVAAKYELLNASFDEALDRILPGLHDGIDMVYLDGSKDKPSNLRYLERLVPSLNDGCLVVFDDIHWSSEMHEMWEAVSARKGFSFTINTGRFGVCVWAGGATQPKMHTLFRIAGIDLYRFKQLLEGTKLIRLFS